MTNVKESASRLLHPVDFDLLYPFPLRRCKVRILIYCDGGIDYSSSGFGLNELITKALNTSSRPFVDFVITKAHRSVRTGTDINNYRFDNSIAAPAGKEFKIANYDQLWLFGNDANPILPLSERKAIADFMNAGGGVFATGDHENLGQALCAEIPRVRSMRKWYYPSAPAGRLVAPSGSNANRLDTTVVGDTAGYQFQDQSDEWPQNIIPRYFNVGSSSSPHPLLSKPGGGVIRVLPDHAHEGECVVPTNLSEALLPGDPRPEYPVAAATGLPLSPEIVAISYSGAGGLTDTFKPAVNPRCFGAIAAYDGHLANVGRVSVDATWHHFLNINLNGTGSSRPGNFGYYVNGSPTAEYEDIKQYFRNIALWLSPPSLQRCFRMRLIFPIRYTFPLIWEVTPIDPKDITIGGLVSLGKQVRRMIAETFSDAEAVQTALTIAAPFNDQRGSLENLLSPTILNAEKKDAKFNIELFDRNAFTEAILGGAVQYIVNNLPIHPQDGFDFLKATDDGKLDDILKTGTQLGLETFKKGYAEQVEISSSLLSGIAVKS